MTLADRLGLKELLDANVDLGDAPGWGDAVRTVGRESSGQARGRWARPLYPASKWGARVTR